MGPPFEEALRALGVPFEVRGAGATARNEVVRFLLGYLESLRRPEDPEAFQASLASGLGRVEPMTLSRLRAHAYEHGRPLTRVMRRLMYVLAARDPARWPLPWGEAAPTDDPILPDYWEFLTEPELDCLHGAMTARHRLLEVARDSHVRLGDERRGTASSNARPACHSRRSPTPPSSKTALWAGCSSFNCRPSSESRRCPISVLRLKDSKASKRCTSASMDANRCSSTWRFR